MDMKSFARSRKMTAPENKTAQSADRENIEKTVEELGKKSEAELINELKNEVEKGKNEGSFSDEVLAEFVEKVSPMLSAEQRRRMEELTKML